MNNLIVSTPTSTSLTLGDLRQAARERADIVNSKFVTDVELDRYLATGLYELYDLLIQRYGNDYFIADPKMWTGDGISNKFALPDGNTVGEPAFYKLLGVDVQLNGAPSPISINYWTSVKKFTFADRNAYVLPFYATRWGRVCLYYRLNGDNIQMMPVPQAGTAFRAHYIPRLKQMTDTLKLHVQMADWGGTTTGWALDVTTFNGDVFTFTADPAQVAVGGAALLADMLANADFMAALTDAHGHPGTVTGENTTIASKARYTITIQTTNHLSVAKRAGGDGEVLFTPIDGILGSADGISGWTDFVVVCAAIKAMVKEESDPSALLLEKQALTTRITSAAEHRDAGQPESGCLIDDDVNGFPGLTGRPSFFY
jgi:hypothetical protein